MILALHLLFAAMPVPPMMELVLDGEVKDMHSIRQGNYTLAEGLVNGFPYWYHQDGKYAIWSFWSTYWMVGPKEQIGSTFGGIVVQFYSTVWPTQILDGFRYSPGWQYASLNEVFFKDCKYKRVGFGISNLPTCSCVQKYGLKINTS